MIIFNDYELLYYIKDNNPQALDFMLKKYSPYIKNNINRLIPYSNKKEDLYIECLLTLLNCIKNFNDKIKVTFFTYFSISLRRTINHELGKSYYKEFILAESTDIIDNNSGINIYVADRLFKDKLSQEIYDECIIGNISISKYCRANNIDYNIVYKRYREIIKQLKLIFH